MRVNREQSRKVQETLFKNGADWVDNDGYSIQHLENPFLYFRCITKKLSYGNGESSFTNNLLDEITYTTFISKYNRIKFGR